MDAISLLVVVVVALLLVCVCYYDITCVVGVTWGLNTDIPVKQ